MTKKRFYSIGLCLLCVTLVSCGGQTQTRFANNLFGKADQLYTTGNYNEAAAVYRRLLAEDGLSDEILSETYQRLADSYNQLGQTEAAVVILTKYLELHPRDSGVHYKMGKSLLALERIEEADDHFRQMLRHGSDIKAYNGIGVTLDLRGNNRGAQQMYLKGLQENPDYIPILNNLALSYVLSGDSEEAIKIFKRINFGRTGNPKLRQNLAIAYAMAGDEASAERVSRIDLTQEEVKQNLDFFGRLRDQRVQALLNHDSIAATQEDILSQVIGGQSAKAKQEAEAGYSQRGVRLARRAGQGEQGAFSAGKKVTGEMPDRGKFTVQIGVYRNQVIAESTADKLRRAGFAPRFENYDKNDGESYRVLRLGDFDKSRDARKAVRSIYDKTQLLGEIYLLDE